MMMAAQCLGIVVINKNQKLVQIMDVAVSSNCNIASEEAEKIKKYKDLSIELYRK